ncbi:SDR family oxidoreductase [Gilvimarinus sp. 1_MG-2023]|uniref:SDR family oxidoreductase n=1 Tax=Gilvimarinus sp. 1_MG-2023 TaxID=3062638 RepID=UPI0026E3FE58|nr:SDR family oxidoreductase [Gilvimarinus sp. 1_MG-2023]MDO6748023.1 SDR family oxidoreductase [Gilvimarinus sp. 1_MG-2023]
MDSEKLLIIGCGDLGRRLAQFSAERSVAITGMRRRIQNAPACATIRYVRGDYTRLTDLKAVISEGYERVLLCPTPSERSDHGYRQGYVQLCQNLVRAYDDLPAPKRVILVSSTSVYGQTDGSWVNETSLTQPQRFSGQRLLEAEEVLRHSGLPVVVARPAGLYGPGRERLITRVLDGAVRASGAFTNRMHIDDAARALDHLLYEVAEPAAIYLLSDGQAPTQGEVVHWLAGQLGAPEPTTEEPDSLNKRVDNRRLLATGFEFIYRSFQAGFTTVIQR